MHEIFSRRLDRVGHCGMPLKGTRDKVIVVMHPPTETVATDSFMTTLGVRREKWEVGMTDADPTPETPVRNTPATFIHALDEENPRFFLVPRAEYQLTLFWRVQHSATRSRVTIPLEDVAAGEDRWDLLDAPGQGGPNGRILRRREGP